MTNLRAWGALFVCSCAGATAHAPPSPVGSTAFDASASGERADAASGPVAAFNDEGMWLLNDFPSDRFAAGYGFTPSQAWLDNVRQSSVRLGGCSASFVSAHGLVMTNHHCAHSCIEQRSTAQKDYVA